MNWVQRIALYVTESRFYLVGSNNTQTSFKVLKLDRTETKELVIVDDRYEYNYQEIRDLLIRIDHGNPNGVTKTVSSFGLLGFVKFLHGYYLILIIKRRKVAAIGYHTIYKVEETKLVYIPNQTPQEFVNEEARYVKAFSSIDLTSNFYFSYSYDISRSLQYNTAPVRATRFLQESGRQTSNLGSTVEEQEQNDEPSSQSRFAKGQPILVRTKPCFRFVWNSHLIDFECLHDDWKIHLIHGFVAQANICVYSKSIFITLIARRSKRYCGTRFLKRGLNLDGDVANEVETEQIVHDASVSNFAKGFYTSFVQLRGSLPDRWSQDATKIVPKPTITQDLVDPYHESTAKHFNDLLRRFGTPVIVLNLIKQKEKKPHESILNDMLNSSIKYLNQFLPQQHIIRLIPFDMARSSKSRNENVMQRLEKIGFNLVRVTGIFQSWRSARKSNYDNTYTLHLRQRTFNRRPSSSRIGGFRLKNGQCLQNGVVRVNCVDSLDRTNTAQFVLGKVALAFQLQALGVLIEPSLDYDTDAVRLLEQLYEDHGDTIALQYGGSQLVHRVKTYRKVAPLTSHSSEIMQTLSRYYSNTFSDAEKQNVINIFLGLRKPMRVHSQTIINNPATDYYLHNQLLLQPFDMSKKTRPHTQWWERQLLKSLPRAYNEHEKDMTCYALEVRDGSPSLKERIDFFFDAYRPYEITYFITMFSNQILHTIKDFMPYGSTDYSPFCLRLAPGKLKEKYLKIADSKRLPPNPSVSGIPSTSSSTSSISLMDSDLTDDTDLDDLSTHPTAVNTSSFMVSNMHKRVSTTDYAIQMYLNDPQDHSMSTEMENDPYGYMILPISAEDFEYYKKYVKFGSSQMSYNQNSVDASGMPEMSTEPECTTNFSTLTGPNLSCEEFVYEPPSQSDMTYFRHYVSLLRGH